MSQKSSLRALKYPWGKPQDPHEYNPLSVVCFKLHCVKFIIKVGPLTLWPTLYSQGKCIVSQLAFKSYYCH